MTWDEMRDILKNVWPLGDGADEYDKDEKEALAECLSRADRCKELEAELEQFSRLKHLEIAGIVAGYESRIERLRAALKVVIVDGHAVYHCPCPSCRLLRESCNPTKSTP